MRIGKVAYNGRVYYTRLTEDGQVWVCPNDVVDAQGWHKGPVVILWADPKKAEVFGFPDLVLPAEGLKLDVLAELEVRHD